MPDTIDRYQVIERLGVGGMGTVWRAHDPVDAATIPTNNIVGATDRQRIRQSEKKDGDSSPSNGMGPL